MMLGTYPLTDESWVALLRERISDAFKSRTASEWERIFTTIKVPAAAVLTTGEWMHGKHASESGLIVRRALSRHEFEGLSSPPTQACGDVCVLEAGPVVWNLASKVPLTREARLQSKTALYDRMRKAQLDNEAEQADDYLATTQPPLVMAGDAFQASSDKEINRRCAPSRRCSKPSWPYTPTDEAATPGATNARAVTQGDEPWLSGIKVVDLCNVIAGPMVGCLLRRVGATVIKVDPSKPSYDALVAVYMGLCTNRGKLSLLTDIKKADSQEILRRLVKWADVVLCNQVPSQMKALGLSEEDLHAINPRVIQMRFDAYGGPLACGPNANKIGYDDILQAHFVTAAFVHAFTAACLLACVYQCCPACMPVCIDQVPRLINSSPPCARVCVCIHVRDACAGQHRHHGKVRRRPRRARRARPPGHHRRRERMEWGVRCVPLYLQAPSHRASRHGIDLARR